MGVLCVVVPFILDVRLVDIPSAGVTQEEGHTGFLHLPSAVLALIFLVKRIQPLLFLVDREVEFCEQTIQPFSTCWTFFFPYIYIYYFFLNPSSCDDTEVRTHVPTSEDFAVTNRTTGATGPLTHSIPPAFREGCHIHMP